MYIKLSSEILTKLYNYFLIRHMFFSKIFNDFFYQFSVSIYNSFHSDGLSHPY